MIAANEPAQNLKISFRSPVGKPAPRGAGKSSQIRAMTLLHDRRPPPADSSGWWDRFVESRESLAFEWIDGRVEGMQRGFRCGAGIRRAGTNGRGFRFESTDATDASARPARDPV